MAGPRPTDPPHRTAAAVLGAGTMGAQIALSLASGGAHVRLWARRPASLAEAETRIEAAYNVLAENGLTDAAERSAVLARIEPDSDLDSAVSERNFVIEAISEDLSDKQELLRRAELGCADGTVMSSTTSAISPTELQSALENPASFCIAHYAQPAHLVELVEVVPGSETSESATSFTVDLLEATGKSPVVCPDIPGFLWARIQHAVLREFASLVGQGLVTPEACDRVLKEGYAARLPAMGAFEHADLAGLDLLNGTAAKAVWADLSNARDPAETPVGALFASGLTGMGSGRGFYDWTLRDAEAFKEQRDREIIRRIKLRRGGHVVL